MKRVIFFITILLTSNWTFGITKSKECDGEVEKLMSQIRSVLSYNLVEIDPTNKTNPKKYLLVSELEFITSTLNLCSHIKGCSDQSIEKLNLEGYKGGNRSEFDIPENVPIHLTGKLGEIPYNFMVVKKNGKIYYKSEVDGQALIEENELKEKMKNQSRADGGQTKSKLDIKYEYKSTKKTDGSLESQYVEGAITQNGKEVGTFKVDDNGYVNYKISKSTLIGRDLNMKLINELEVSNTMISGRFHISNIMSNEKVKVNSSVHISRDRESEIDSAVLKAQLDFRDQKDSFVAVSSGVNSSQSQPNLRVDFQRVVRGIIASGYISMGEVENEVDFEVNLRPKNSKFDEKVTITDDSVSGSMKVKTPSRKMSVELEGRYNYHENDGEYSAKGNYNSSDNLKFYVSAHNKNGPGAGVNYTRKNTQVYAEVTGPTPDPTVGVVVSSNESSDSKFNLEASVSKINGLNFKVSYSSKFGGRIAEYSITVFERIGQPSASVFKDRGVISFYEKKIITCKHKVPDKYELSHKLVENPEAPPTKKELDRISKFNKSKKFDSSKAYEGRIDIQEDRNIIMVRDKAEKGEVLNRGRYIWNFENSFPRGPKFSSAPNLDKLLEVFCNKEKMPELIKSFKVQKVN